MSYAKVSLSLDEQDIAFLDGETRGGRFTSRSAAVQAAVRLLRESRLADAYAEAFGEWAESGGAESGGAESGGAESGGAESDSAWWDAASADGIS